LDSAQAAASHFFAEQLQQKEMQWKSSLSLRLKFLVYPNTSLANHAQEGMSQSVASHPDTAWNVSEKIRGRTTRIILKKHVLIERLEHQSIIELLP
jgi:hypothetical protein